MKSGTPVEPFVMRKRIVCLVVAEKNGLLEAIPGTDFVDALTETLKAYQFTKAGVGHVLQVIVGEEPVPANGLAGELDAWEQLSDDIKT